MFAYNSLLTDMATNYFTVGSFKLMLLNDLYIPSEEHKFRSDVSAYEISGTGYPSGGIAQTFTITTVDTTQNRLEATCLGATFSNATITARYAASYKVIGSVSTDRLCGLINFGANRSTTGTSFVVNAYSFPIINIGVA